MMFVYRLRQLYRDPQRCPTCHGMLAEDYDQDLECVCCGEVLYHLPDPAPPTAARTKRRKPRAKRRQQQEVA